MLFPNLTDEHERNWRDAVSDNPSIQRQALAFWVRRLDELPGPILFTVPKSKQQHGAWRHIMQCSQPYCACGERRWLFPANSAHFHAPEDPTPITIGAGAQLALGACGADLYQTQIQVSVENGYILTHLLPYSPRSREELIAMGSGVIERPEIEAHGHSLKIQGPLLGTTVARDSLADLASALEEEQRPINRFVHIQIEGTNEVFGWVMYQTTNVDTKANTMQVVVSATVQVMDRSVRPRPHTCKRR